MQSASYAVGFLQDEVTPKGGLTRLFAGSLEPPASPFRLPGQSSKMPIIPNRRHLPPCKGCVVERQDQCCGALAKQIIVRPHCGLIRCPLKTCHVKGHAASAGAVG